MSAGWPTVYVFSFHVLLEPLRSAVSVPDAPGAVLIVWTSEGFAA
jgi:hypothetical protein